jgi:hypothetical protein
MREDKDFTKIIDFGVLRHDGKGMSLEVEDYSSKDEYCNKKDEDYTVDN